MYPQVTAQFLLKDITLLVLKPNSPTTLVISFIKEFCQFNSKIYFMCQGEKKFKDIA